MTRTTIMLPAELKERARRLAQDQGISFGELVRRSLAAALEERRGTLRQRDPLFGDLAVFEGDVPEDLSSEHDRYLYGPGREG